MGFVVGNNRHQFAAEAAAAPAEDEVVEAMPKLGDHYQDALLGLVMEAELHVEALCDGTEFILQLLGRVALRAGESRPQVQRLA